MTFTGPTAPPSFSKIQIHGPDALSFTHRILSRNILQMKTEEWRVSLLLTAQGKVICWFWLQTVGAQTLNVLIEDSQEPLFREGIESYRFTESLEVSTTEQHSLTPISQPHEGSVSFRDLHLKLSKPEERVNWEPARIRARMPFLRHDFPSPRLAFELDLAFACDRNKGCYVGQEVIERVLSRSGDSALVLTSLASSQAAPSDEAKNTPVLNQEEQAVGETTLSSCYDESRDETLWLAYIRRKSLKSAEPLFLSFNGRKIPIRAV